MATVIKCDICVSKASNVITDECEKVFDIESNTEMLRLNEVYINIYEADGKEELRTSCKVYKTLDKALKKKKRIVTMSII